MEDVVDYHRCHYLARILYKLDLMFPQTFQMGINEGTIDAINYVADDIHGCMNVIKQRKYTR